MAEIAPPASHSPPHAPQRPKGILKNTSFQQSSPDTEMTSPIPSTNADSNDRPTGPSRELSEREIVQQNTEKNAGAQRRASSTPRGNLTPRTAGQANGDYGDGVNGGVKWDEANLYLNEGQMGGKMKIDEPKTPFVREYDPDKDDELDSAALDPEGVVVDELDQKKKDNQRTKEMDIPDIDIGEPKIESSTRQNGDLQQSSQVINDGMDMDGGNSSVDVDDASLDPAEKHRKFEEARKKHYEMKNVKNLLGHPLPDADAE